MSEGEARQYLEVALKKMLTSNGLYLQLRIARAQ
jgi:hypothetical protein